MDRVVSRSLANFAAKFCNELGTSKTSVCSPLSAETVLALLALGCRGPTRAELLQALDMADDDAIRSSFTLLTSSLKSIKGATVNMANRIYVQEGFILKPAVRKDAEEVFESGLEQLDFNEKEAAAGVINQWVAQKTNDVIKDIVTADTFEGETCLLLINAIYFKGEWEIPFEDELTANRDFFIKKGTVISVPQMHMEDMYFAYGSCKGLKAKLLRLPYRGGEASMVIVLPDEIEGLDTIMKLLARGYDLQTDIEGMTKIEIDITIPKFQAEMTIDLKDILTKLGIKSIFHEETSDIDMLTSDKRQFVSDAIQKAFINVNELGTEAGAATMLRMMMLCAKENPTFIANRPFLYLVMCHEIPLFIGVYKGSEFTE